MNEIVISFSDITESHESKLKHFQKNRYIIIFNGNFLQETTDETVKVLKLLKKYNVTCVKNNACINLCNMLYSDEDVKINDLMVNFFKTDEIPIEARKMFNISESEKNSLLKRNVLGEDISETKQNFRKLFEALKYYHETSVDYIIKDRILYIGNVLKLSLGLNTRETIRSGNYPISKELYEEILYLDNDDFETIVLPLPKFGDFGFSDVIGNYRLVSTNVEYSTSDEALFREEVIPKCFFDGENFFGVSSNGLTYKYNPTRILVCSYEDTDNNENYFFRILEAKKCNVWFNSINNKMFVVSQHKTPKNLNTYFYVDFLYKNYKICQEQFCIDNIDSYTPVGSPV